MYGMIYEIHIELASTHRPVWRTVHVHKKMTFEQLHQLIQLLFDWWDDHPYQFTEAVSEERVIFQRGKNSTNYEHIGQANLRIEEVLNEIGEGLYYIYGDKRSWQLQLTLQQIITPLRKNNLYPICISADKELIGDNMTKDTPLQFPFDKQRAFEGVSLVKRLNRKIAHNIVQYTISDWEQKVIENCWFNLANAIDRYYKEKPWEQITNQQVFAIYDSHFDEYLFCTILGKESDLLGLSVYIGFNGLLSLHTSLTKNLNIDQLFQLHDNLLLQFNPKDESPPASTPFYENDEVYAQLTSYKPGYFPWKLNEKEALLLTLAIEQTLYLFERIKQGYKIPNYIEEDQFLILTIDRKKSQIKKRTVTFEHMIKKVLPLQVTITKQALEELHTLGKESNLSVQFSLQYLQVPVQRLKDQRPLLPLSSVIVDETTKEIVYHNIYDTYLDYSIVQHEFLHMIQLFGVIPGKIKTDELTYHYIKPLLLKIDLPFEVTDSLLLTERINKAVSHLLLTKAE